MIILIEILEKENQFVHLNRPISDHTWVFFMLLIVLFLFIYGRNNYSKSFQKLINAAFNENAIKEILRDQHLLVKRAIIIFNSIFILSTSLVLYQLIKYYNIHFEIEGIALYGVLTGGLTILYFIRYCSMKIFAFVFKLYDVMDECVINLVVINGILGMLCIPFVILMEYMATEHLEFTVNITLLVLFAVLAYRYLRGFYLAKRYIAFYRMYFFLYLCTFEIFPWLFLYKIFILSTNL